MLLKVYKVISYIIFRKRIKNYKETSWINIHLNSVIYLLLTNSAYANYYMAAKHYRNKPVYKQIFLVASFQGFIHVSHKQRTHPNFNDAYY